MNRFSTKTAAEELLRELPSVLGAYVSEDLEGYPREIHLLIADGPDAGSLARDIRSLLEERLGVPIDQRVISIAQLAPDAGGRARRLAEAKTDELDFPEEALAAHRPDPEPRPLGSRPVFGGLESTTASGHVTVGVRLEWRGEASKGTATAVDTLPGRARAAASATLRSAVEASWNDGLGLELDFASLVQALDGEYVLVSVLGTSARIGRRPLTLVGAHPVESDVETASALASLKAINRILSIALKADP